jgi:site-specific DNA-methyltransferase (adenine-specific)
MKRIARNNKTPFFFFCDMKLAVDLINSNRKWFRYDIVVKKTRKVGFLNAKRMPMKSHELLLVFYKNLPLYNLEANHTLTETEILRDFKEKMGKVYGGK